MDQWFAGAASQNVLPSAVGNLKRFNAKRKFRAEIAAIKLDNRMKKTLLGLRVEALIIDMLRDRASALIGPRLARPPAWYKLRLVVLTCWCDDRPRQVATWSS